MGWNNVWNPFSKAFWDSASEEINAKNLK